MTESDSVRLARIETKLDTLLIPAITRLEEIEGRTQSLERWRSMTKGALAILSLITSGLMLPAAARLLGIGK